ncbi:hypothetical protein PVAP13_5KG198014 [Panicum virgatum]|uniref:Uncharacterized protein n=1 Tax=Panicum virgatum TaxID=38727 RepID=A0A8T0SEW5_PANVG|nr:hypothetical protein PVAP13_5KG198014 [Panicum virgatum]
MPAGEERARTDCCSLCMEERRKKGMSSVGRTASNRCAGWTRRARARRRLQPRTRVVESLRRRVYRRRLVRASSRPCAAASAGAVSSRASSRPYAAASVGGSRGGRRRPGRERPTSRQPWWSASPWWPASGAARWRRGGAACWRRGGPSPRFAHLAGGGGRRPLTALELGSSARSSSTRTGGRGRRTSARACPSQPRARPRRSSHPKRHRAQAAPASSVPATARCSIRSAPTPAPLRRPTSRGPRRTTTCSSSPRLPTATGAGRTASL